MHFDRRNPNTQTTSYCQPWRPTHPMMMMNHHQFIHNSSLLLYNVLVCIFQRSGKLSRPMRKLELTKLQTLIQMKMSASSPDPSVSSTSYSSSGGAYSGISMESVQLRVEDVMLWHIPSLWLPQARPSLPVPRAGSGLWTRDSQLFDSKLNVLIPQQVQCLQQFGVKVEDLATSPNFMLAVCTRLN